MGEKCCGESRPKKKSFFGRLFEKLDKKMEEKAKAQPCCKPVDKDKKSCCS